MTIVKQYGNYIEIECCTECDYALEDGSEVDFAPVPNVCPKCGGKTAFTIGRWIYSEIPAPWYAHFFIGFGPKTVYHGFEKGRERDINHKKLVVEPCDCDGCKISDSGEGYQPCHNRDKLSSPTEKDSTTIDEFMELAEPMVYPNGKWIVYVKDDEFLVLSLARDIKYGPEFKASEFEFDTEMNAHFAAKTYYARHKVYYPYFDRLLELCDENFQ